MGNFKLDEQKLNSLKTYKDKGLRTVIGCVVALSIFTIGALSTVENGAKAETNENQKFVACFGCSHYDADTNSCIEWDKWSRWCEANFPTKTLEERDEWGRYPWKLNAEWTSQEMPEVKWTDSHQRFKELCQAYWLDPSKIWELENKYNLREGVLLAILIAETSWGHNGEYVDEGCYNLWNVWNNDSWDRVCFEWKWESIEQVAMTLNNRHLWNVLTLGCLSNAWSCVRYFDSWKRYATSNGNWERNMLNVLNTIYEDELGEINASKFSVRRDFISLQ